MEEVINLLLVAILIIATAFFVAAEFALVRVRPTRINQLAMEGNKSARAVQQILENLDGYLSACQLGITVTALGIGWLGEPTVHQLLHPLFVLFDMPVGAVNTLSFVFAFSIITFLHVVLGELTPKTFAIQKDENICLWVARPLINFSKIMYPFIWLLNRSARGLARLLGLEPANEHEHAHSEEELRLILTESLEGGEINAVEYEYVNNIFKFDERVAREIMVPRTEMVCLYIDAELDEHLQTIREEGYTRYPVADGDKDRIIGILHTKKLLMQFIEDKEIDLKSLVRPALFANEATPIEKLIRIMQEEVTSVVILIDEYGGTAGMVTMEDILEEIVGEIRDEFDVNERPPIEKLGKNHFIVDNKLLLTEVEELTGIEGDPEFDTIGGWLAAHIPEIEEGRQIVHEGWQFKIQDTEGRQIKHIEIVKIQQ